MFASGRYNVAMCQPRCAIVFLPNWVGDVVMATPTLRTLRAQWPETEIVYFGRPIALATLAGTDWADGTIADESHKRPCVVHFFRTLANLRGRKLDMALLLPNSFRTAALARLAGITRIAGYDRDGRGWMLTDKCTPERNEKGGFVPVPTIDYYIRLAETIGVTVNSRQMELPVEADEERAAEQMLAEAGMDRRRPVVMLNPGASFGPSKLWPAERYAVLADTLAQRDRAQIIINAAPSEKPIAAEVQRHMREKPLVSFAERDNRLGLLKSLLRRCDVLVTNDTGARHIACAMGIGVVTLFGSTDPVWAQIDYPRERIVRADVPCSPCQKKQCPNPPGPTRHQCMLAIEPERVLHATESLLGERKEAGDAS